MAVGIPMLQLVLFGYAINTDPKGLPTAMVTPTAAPVAQHRRRAAEHRLLPHHHTGTSEAEGDALIERGKVQFLIVIPPDFSRQLVRGERPACWCRWTPPTRRPRATPLPRWATLANQALRRTCRGRCAALQPRSGPVRGAHPPPLQPGGPVALQHRAGADRHHFDHDHGDADRPGHDARARAWHHGKPAGHAGAPSEVMVGKILPYVVMGYVQLGGDPGGGVCAVSGAHGGQLCCC
jgi:ABC-2 type transport system permease protein